MKSNVDQTGSKQAIETLTLATKYDLNIFIMRYDVLL
jgi:hypothetical protein